MVAKNDVTGDSIQTKGVSNSYRDNYDLIFRKNNKQDNYSETEDKLTRYNDETQEVKK